MISPSADRIPLRPREGELAVRAITGMIRAKSEEGQLISRSEIIERLLDQGLIDGKEEGIQKISETLLERALEENGDIIKLHSAEKEPHFFSSQFMSESYAKILVKKGADPVLLVVEVVRENSAIYPRPVPLDMFKVSPFDFTPEEIQAYLAQITKRDGCTDICQTTSSIGTVFLYSTLHLNPGYASMLAEWADVGQADNP